MVFVFLYVVFVFLYVLFVSLYVVFVFLYVVFVFLYVVFVFFPPVDLSSVDCIISLFPLFQMGLRIAYCVFAKSPCWASGTPRLWPIDLHLFPYNANYSHVHPR